MSKTILAFSWFFVFSSQFEPKKPDNKSMINRILHLIIFLLSFTLEVKIAHAKERHELFNGVRQLGMGGAGIGVVNDETSLLLNPNGLGKIRDPILTVVDPELSLADDFSSHIMDGGDPLDYFSLDGMVSALNESQERHMHSKLQLFPSIAMPNFGFGLFKKISYDATLSEDGTEIDFDYFDDTALVLGYNFRFLDGRLKFGFTGKYLNRAHASEVIPSSTTSADVDDYVSEGIAVGADVGLMLSAPWTWLPSVAVVVRDVGNTKFSHGSGMFTDATEIPETLHQTIDAAFSFFPLHGNRVRSSFSFELRDIENISEEEDIRRRTHAGWELNVYDFLFLRAGMNQRYWTAGLEFATENLQFQFATYGEDIGADEVPEEDRRFVFKFAFRF